MNRLQKTFSPSGYSASTRSVKDLSKSSPRWNKKNFIAFFSHLMGGLLVVILSNVFSVETARTKHCTYLSGSICLTSLWRGILESIEVACCKVIIDTFRSLSTLPRQSGKESACSSRCWSVVVIWFLTSVRIDGNLLFLSRENTSCSRFPIILST